MYVQQHVQITCMEMAAWISAIVTTAVKFVTEDQEFAGQAVLLAGWGKAVTKVSFIPYKFWEQ